jgi:hypothetical protein
MMRRKPKFYRLIIGDASWMAGTSPGHDGGEVDDVGCAGRRRFTPFARQRRRVGWHTISIRHARA